MGRLVDLTAKAKSGWEFIRWDNGRTSPTITVAAGDKPVYVAKFEQLRHVKVVADPDKAVQVTSAGELWCQRLVYRLDHGDTYDLIVHWANWLRPLVLTHPANGGVTP